jgi:hypothetical protein
MDPNTFTYTLDPEAFALKLHVCRALLSGLRGRLRQTEGPSSLQGRCPIPAPPTRTLRPNPLPWTVNPKPFNASREP